ncbi:MAG: molybdopterin-dependent oxidoreductase, partial [Negativicutes bacterium]|nr:molybdopterin-dependent oxidoreductase [Negativicutes bacterium]
MWKKSFSRRTFLKATAATVAAASAADALSFGDWLKKAEAAEVKVVPSLCGSCSAECGMWVHVKNGRVWKATGQKDHPSSRGKLCARGHAALSIPYHKDRITHPMKRLGENHYVPITWEEAYAEISAKLKEMLAKYGPEPMAYIENPRPTASFYGKRFAQAIGCPTTTTHHSICFNSRTAANNHVIGPLATADVANAKYVLFLGRNYAEGLSPSNTATLTTAYEKGVKIVIVDPRHSAACIMASEWVPIRPGTDLGMLLAIAHVLIKEDLYDKDFVAQYGLGSVSYTHL